MFQRYIGGYNVFSYYCLMFEKWISSSEDVGIFFKQSDLLCFWSVLDATILDKK